MLVLVPLGVVGHTCAVTDRAECQNSGGGGHLPKASMKLVASQKLLVAIGEQTEFFHFRMMVMAVGTQIL